MALKVLHTADWHIGQTFHTHDRTPEHKQFLDWLISILRDKKIDLLLVSGDVFDNSNPSIVSTALFYNFLATATKVCPKLQIIITAGNHDSATRLEVPNPLLKHFNINIVGSIKRKEDHSIDYESLLMPIKNIRTDKIQAWCLAIPFLRIGDTPKMPEEQEDSYTNGIIEVYKQAYAFALSKKQKNQAVIAMGHLHTANAELISDDKERAIIGGVECVPVSAFHEDIAYTALGHIHKAQRVGGRENVRYSGSPLPISFSEIHYKHQVILFEIEDEKAVNIQPLEVPITVELIGVPKVHSPLKHVLEELENLKNATEDDVFSPYLEVRVLIEKPEPLMKYQVENSIKNKAVRFIKIDPRYPESSKTEQELLSYNDFKELKPLDLLKKIYEDKYPDPIPDELVVLFNEAYQEVFLGDR